MVAALILVISGAMLAQFVVFFWRANMVHVAAQPLSDRARWAQNGFSSALTQNGFSAITAISQICPSLGSRSAKLWPVRAYYCTMRSLAWLCEAALPQASSWARREMTSCTQYVAVSMDVRLQSNQEFLAQLRSY